MNPPFQLWLLAFVLTCACELPVATVGLSRRMPWERALVGALGAQLLTHPALWYLVPRFSPWWAWMLLAEAGVTLVEATVFVAILRAAGDDWRDALVRGPVVALTANALSLGVGLVLQWIGVL